ncbi:MAG: hypothetical protein WAM91_10530 [Candidatus Acidiferrales bacterium]
MGNRDKRGREKKKPKKDKIQKAPPSYRVPAPAPKPAPQPAPPPQQPPPPPPNPPSTETA